MFALLIFQCAFDIVYQSEVPENAIDTMLRIASSLPFAHAFDLLFRYRLVSQMEGRRAGSECLLDLFQRIVTKHCISSTWLEIISACYVVQQLAHPAHTLFLLVPVEIRIPDSVRAWSVVRRFTGLERTPPAPAWILIRAMKAFLPPDSQSAYEWLSICDLTKQKLLSEWLKLAADNVCDYHFTQRWFTLQSDACRWDGGSIREVVKNRAHDELAKSDHAKNSLEGALIRIQLRAAKAQKRNARRLTPDQQRLARSEAAIHYAAHIKILSKVESALRNIASFNAAHLASMVRQLGDQYPKIKWNLKRKFHRIAAERTALGCWHIERLLSRAPAKRAHDPMKALCAE